MKWFRVKLSLKSWVASSWQSDTIFGHLCWGMRYLHGEEKLRAFIQKYNDGSPPLLLSNGFPVDFMPRPITDPLSIDPTLSLDKQREQFEDYKEVRKSQYLLPDEFDRAIGGETVLPSPDSKPDEKKRVTLKNQINRLTCTTGEEGTLYNFEEYYWSEVTIYLKLEDDFVDTAENLFQYIADTGYGKRKSVGYGQVESMTFEPFGGFNVPANANGFVTLSNFVPATNDPVHGNWQTIVKYGKMGEEYASEEHAFKKPLLMLEAGSTFYDAPCRECYGRLVRDLSGFYQQAVQYAFALPVPMMLPQNTKQS